MIQKRYLNLVLIICLFLISIGSFLLHVRTHPVTPHHLIYLIPFIAGLISILVLPIMFLNKGLVPYAYLANGMMAIIGTITMVHYLIQYLPRRFNLNYIFMKTLLPDLLILWGVFLIGKMLFDVEMMSSNNFESPRNKGRFIRFPNMGYWLIHLGALSLVYFLGHVLWK